MSDGLTSATGEVFGPFRLDQDFACGDRSALREAALSAADPTVDFTQFSGSQCCTHLEAAAR